MNFHHKLLGNNKGIGTVFGMVFFLLIVMVVFASFVIVLNQNTSLEQVTINAKQMDLDRYTELTTVSVANPEIAVLNSVVYISCTITNNGTLPAELVRLWIKDVTNSSVGQTIMSPSIIIQPGSSIQYFNFTRVANAGLLDQFSFWFISTRGNTISAFPNTNQLNGIAPIENFPGVTDINSNYTGDQTPLRLSLNTTKPNQLIYVVVAFDDENTLHTPTSTPSLTWIMRSQSLDTDYGSLDGDSTLETFYAIKPSIGPLQINIQSTADELSDYYCSALAFAISDVNTTSPFDGSAQTSVGKSTLPQDTITTHYSNELIIGALCIDSLNPTINPGAGFAEIMPVQSSYGASGESDAQPRSVWSEWDILGAPRTNLPVNCTFTSSKDWAIIVDAVRLVVVPPTAPVSFSPNSGPIGQPVTVSGQGFAGNSPLIATFDGLQIPFRFTTDSSGNIPPNAIFNVPQGSTAGIRNVIIIDSKFNFASANFTVTTPIIIVTPQNCPAGTIATLTASNYITNSTMAINCEGNTFLTNPSTVTSDAAGSFSATFTASGTAGVKQIWGSDGVNNVSASFTIIPNIIISPTSGVNGDHATLSGQGFAANSNFTLSFDNQAIPIPPTNALIDAGGSFDNLIFTTQSSTLGTKNIIVIDANGNSATTTYTLVQATAVVSASSFEPASQITLGSSVLVLVSVSAPPETSIPPSGNVQFQVRIGSGSFTNFGSPVKLLGGTASISYAPSLIGTYSFQAIYLGDSNYFSGTTGAASGTLTVYIPSSTSTVLSATSPITLGGTTTDSATVNPQTYLYNQVAFIAADPGYGFTSTSAQSIAYPSGWQANDLLLLQITVRDTTNSPSTPSGFTIMYGPDSSTVGRQWIYYRFATSSDSSSASVTIAGSACKIVRMYDFRNVAALTFTESPSFGYSSGSATISAQPVTTTAVNRLAVSFVFATDNNALSAFSGETGGNWDEPVSEFPSTSGSHGVVQLQTATMPTAGTITGGSLSMAGSDSWGERTFALIPSTALPTGDINFQVLAPGGSWITYSTQPLAYGTATSTTYSPNSIGTWYFRAIYGGDSNYVGSQSGDSDESLVVGMGTAIVERASFVPASPIALGTSVTVSAGVSGPNGFPAPTGTVQFQVSINSGSYVNFGAVATLLGGVASITYNPPSIGTYNFLAVYLGDSNYVSGTPGASSTTLTVKGNPNVPSPTLNPSSSTTIGTSVSLSITITGSGATPTGTATFQVKINGGAWSNIGSAITLNGVGFASITYVPSTADSYQFQVVYSGDINYVGATGSISSLTVNKATLTLSGPSVNPNPDIINHAVTASITIIGVSGGPIPSGSATFQVKIGTGSWTNIGSAITLSNGVATTTYNPTTVNTYQFQVSYSGDINYNSATSSATTVNVLSGTFGNQNTGTGTNNQDVSNIIRGASYLAPATGTLQSITAYISVTSTSRNIQAAIYSTSGTLLGTSNAVSGLSGGAQSVTFNFNVKPSLTAGTSYLLVISANSGGSGGSNHVYLYYSSTGASGIGDHTGTVTYNTWPSVTFTGDIYQYCIYGTYSIP